MEKTFGKLVINENEHVNTKPKVNESQAIETVKKTYNKPFDKITAKLVLRIVKTKKELSWKIKVNSQGHYPPDLFIYFVDALTGKITYSFNNLKLGFKQEVLTFDGKDAFDPKLGKKYFKGLKIFGGKLKRLKGHLFTLRHLLKENSESFSKDSYHNEVVRSSQRSKDVYDFFKQVFNRDSWDDHGAPIISYCNVGGDINNAVWLEDGIMVYFSGKFKKDGKELFGYFDDTTAAHEFAHGVTSAESNLIYDGESGCLSESFSDIMAMTFDKYDLKQKKWYVFNKTHFKIYWPIKSKADILGKKNREILRHMDDPTLDGKSVDCYAPDIGKLDCHYCSGIGNLFFFLLTMGGKHPKGNCGPNPTIDVKGIGIEKAAKIVYFSNKYYWVDDSDYALARAAAIQVAIDFYEEDIVQAVKDAWTAVNVLESPDE